MVETSLDRSALAEVYNVLMMLEASVFKKIPNDIIQAIKNNMDADYKVEWDKLQKRNYVRRYRKNTSSNIYRLFSNSRREKCDNTIRGIESQKHVSYF